MNDGTRPWMFALRSLAHFLAAFVAFLALCFCAPALAGRPVAVPIVVGLLAVAAGLVFLALRSSLIVDADGLAVRFFGLRCRRVRWERLATAEYGMSLWNLALRITQRSNG